MPNQILQVDENMLETKLDRLVSEKVEQLLNAMLDAEADEITGRVQAFVYAGMQDECGQTRARGRAPRPRGARRGLHADERVPVDAPLPERGDTGTDGQEKRADAGRTDARGRR